MSTKMNEQENTEPTCDTMANDNTETSNVTEMTDPAEGAEGKDTTDMSQTKVEAEKPQVNPDPPVDGQKLLDLAFAMDCTGSMGSYIYQAQENIRKIVEEIVSKESADVRLALVEYRDHPPQDSTFVTRVHDFTDSVREMKGWLDDCSASGGGDGPEAVADALHQVLKLNWRQTATKICVFISDAPPHGLGMDCGDGFPNGCPDGLDPMEIAGKLAEKSITVYLVGCEPSINRYRQFFMALAHVTGGKYVPLSKAQLLTAVISGGAQEELSLEALMQEVNEEVEEELRGAEEGSYSHRDLSRKIHSKMASKGYKAKSLQLNKAEMPSVSATAEKLSYCMNLADVRKNMPAEEMARGYDDYSRGGGGGGSRGSARRKSSKKSKSVRGRTAAPPADMLPPTPEAAAAPPPERNSSLLGSVTDTMSGWFGYKKSEPETWGSPPEAVSSPPAAMCSVPAPRPTSAAGDEFLVVEDDLGEEQVHRMVQKSLMQKNLRSKTKHSD